ncbi:hypothetical protein ACQ24F_000143 [Yersinia enterocolitica]
MPEVASVKIPVEHNPYVTKINNREDIEKPELSYEYTHSKISKSIESKVLELLDTQEETNRTLTDIRVKLARKQFFINVIELTVSLASFAMSVGVSICSGGVAAPLAVVTGLHLMLSILNLACAYHNWDCASKNKDELTMGSDALQQAVFMLAKYCNASPKSAKKIARYTSYFVRVGIVVSLGAIGVLIHPDMTNSLCLLAKNYVPMLSSMLSVIIAGALGVWINNCTDEKDEAEKMLTTNEGEVYAQLSKFDGILLGLNNTRITPAVIMA